MMMIMIVITKNLMLMQDDDDFYIATINSNNESDSFLENIPFPNINDDSNNETLHEEPKNFR